MSLSRYPITISANVAPDLRAWLLTRTEGNAAPRTVVLCDTNTEAIARSLMTEIGTSEDDVLYITIPSGEVHKNLATAEHIWCKMLEAGIDRRAIMLNIGGGVVGDIGGFCAATYKRGIAFVQIPTTLLAQVDASVGGKVAVDVGGIKNSVGVFCEPEAVFISTNSLATLSARELRSGFAEMVKHALIADAAMWETMHATTDFRSLITPHFIEANVAIKARIVARDFKEQAERQVLNFGHTFGHSFEAALLTTPHAITHGEAVAAGMVCEAFVAGRVGRITQAQLHTITRYVLHIFGKIQLAGAGIDPAQLIALMANDKKNTHNTVNLVLLEGIGAATFGNATDEDLLRDALAYYEAL